VFLYKRLQKGKKSLEVNARKRKMDYVNGLIKRATREDAE